MDREYTPKFEPNARYQLTFKFPEIVKRFGMGGAYRYWVNELGPQVQSIFPQGDYSETGAIWYDEIEPLQLELIQMMFPGAVFGLMDWERRKWVFIDHAPLPEGMIP